MYAAGSQAIQVRRDGLLIAGTGINPSGDVEAFVAGVFAPTPLPSISFGGLALLAGLVLGIVGWARRCS